MNLNFFYCKIKNQLVTFNDLFKNNIISVHSEAFSFSLQKKKTTHIFFGEIIYKIITNHFKIELNNLSVKYYNNNNKKTHLYTSSVCGNIT